MESFYVFTFEGDELTFTLRFFMFAFYEAFCKFWNLWVREKARISSKLGDYASIWEKILFFYQKILNESNLTRIIADFPKNIWKIYCIFRWYLLQYTLLWDFRWVFEFQSHAPLTNFVFIKEYLCEMKTKLIELKNICKSFDGEQVLANVDL